MKAREVALLRLSAPLEGGAGNARASWATRDAILLRISDGDGGSGTGEAAPLPGYSADTLATCEAALSGLDWEAVFALLQGPQLVPASCAIFFERTDQLSRSLPPAARHAVETALLDLLGKRQGVPVSRLLVASPRPVPLNALLGGEDPDAVLTAARAAVARGITTLKLKVGRRGRWEHELALLRALRSELPTVALRLDANGVWPLHEAADKLAALAPLELEFVEEPTASSELAELLGRPERARVPIALDESLQQLSADAAAGLFATGAIAAVVLKPMALGGLGRCMRWAQRAAAASVDAVVTHLFDGPVALAAAAELAVVLPRTRACGLDLGPGLGLGVQPAGVTDRAVVPGTAPGLGLPAIAGAWQTVWRS